MGTWSLLLTLAEWLVITQNNSGIDLFLKGHGDSNPLNKWNSPPIIWGQQFSIGFVGDLCFGSHPPPPHPKPLPPNTHTPPRRAFVKCFRTQPSTDHSKILPKAEESLCLGGPKMVVFLLVNHAALKGVPSKKEPHFEVLLWMDDLSELLR